MVSLRQLGTALVDLFFPPLCVVCKTPAPRHLCDRCIAGMPWQHVSLCDRCGGALVPAGAARNSLALRSGLCARCRRDPPAFDFCRAYGPFRGALRDAIHALKYEGKTAVAPGLSGLLAQVVDGEPILQRARVLIPVPLHLERRKERGYNQAEMLAAETAARWSMDIRPDLLAKVRHTQPQVGLSAAERRANLQGAFVFAGPASLDVPVLLVDDVTTTGATFHECAHVLRAAGAPAVYAVALAHG